MDENTNEQITSSMAVRRAKELVDISADQYDERELQKIVRELEALAAKYPDVEEITIRLSEGLFNLSHDQDQEEGLKTVNRLEELAAKHPDVTEITVQYAKGLARLSYESEGAAAYDIVNRLEKVAMQHLDVTVIVALYAIGLANLSYEQEGMALFQTVGKLENLVSEYRGEMNIVASYAEGLANLCFEDEEVTVSRAFDRLGELVEEYPNSDKIREEYDRALEYLESLEDDDAEWDTASDMEEPEEESPDDAGMIPPYAGQELGEEQQEAIRAVEKLRSFLVAHPENTEAAVELAKGLQGLCGIQGMQGWQAAAMLEYLSADYPEVKGVTTELAKGWILLSRVVDELSAVAVNAKLDGLVMLNPYLVDVVKAYKGELDQAE